MSILSGVGDFFGLDIGASAVRLVHAPHSGDVASLARYAYVPLDGKISLSDSEADRQKLAQAIKELVAQAKVPTANVAVGIPSNRVFTTVVDFDKLSPAELEKAIKLQAGSLIPTPIESSKVDWAVTGDSPVDTNKVEVLLSSVPNEYVEKRLDMLESIGLNVVALEPDNLAMARAIFDPTTTTAQMAIDIGVKTTDLVISIGGIPRLCRSIPTGSEAIIKSAMQNLSIDEKQAEQFVFKFGLSKDKLEGQVHNAILGTIETLTAEIEKSIKFVTTRYKDVAIERIIVIGAAAALPELPVFVANKFKVNVEIGNAWRNVSFATKQQNELLAVSNHFAVAAGLAGRTS